MQNSGLNKELQLNESWQPNETQSAVIQFKFNNLLHKWACSFK